MNLKDAIFAEKIELVKKSSMGVPKIINIDLSLAIVDQVYDIAGNVFYIFSGPGETDYVGIKVNETREPIINYSVHCGLITPFYRLYITTPAGQTGTLQIIYGTEAPELMEILDHRSTTVAGVGGILDELRGDVTPENWGLVPVSNLVATEILAANADRKALSIQLPSMVETDTVILGFDDTVTNAKFFYILYSAYEFTRGSWRMNDYRGAIWGLASAIDIFVAVGEW